MAINLDLDGEYCQYCNNFEAETIREDWCCFNEIKSNYYIKCKNRSQCRSIRDYLRKNKIGDSNEQPQS